MAAGLTCGDPGRARRVAAQALGQRLECRQRCEQRLHVVVGQLVEVRRQARAALRADALVQREAGGGGLDARGAAVVGVGLAADQPRLGEPAGDAREHRRVDALDLGELGQPQRAAARDGGEDGELGGGEALAGLSRAQVAGRDAERDAQPLDRFALYLRLRGHLSPILAC